MAIPNQTMSTINGVADLLNGVGGFATDVLAGDQTGIDYRFKAQEAGFNAQEAGISVKELWNQEIFNEGKVAIHGAQMEGGEVAAEAAQGLNVHSRASTAITNETSNVTGRDIYTLRNNAFMKAFGYKAQQIQDTAEATLNTIKANQAEDVGLFGGISKFVGSGLKAVGELGWQ